MRIRQKISSIRADWKALAFCILAACTFWLLNALNQDYTDTISYPFKIEYNVEEMIPLEDLPDKIKLNVTAYGWVMLRKSLGINAEPVVYNLEKLPKKKYITATQLSPIISKQLSDLNLNFLVTDTVFLNFDKLKTKKIKIVVDSAALPLAPTFHKTSPVILSPDSIIVRGANSLIRELPDTLLLEIPGEDLKGDFEESIKIPESKFDVRLELLTKEIKVRFSSASFEKESLVLKVKPSRFPADTSAYSFDRKIILTYFVKEEDKGKVKPEDFQVVLNYRKMDRKDSTIVPVLTLKPAFIQEFYFTPYAIRVRKK